jgi:uncharacterized membrane protein YeiH
MFAATVLSPPLWIELSAIVAGALAGAVFAARRGLDLVGILAIAPRRSSSRRSWWSSWW